MSYRISIARNEHKFSCAHMTVFPDGTKERLHGHNYQLALALDVERVDFASMVPFQVIKDAIRELCKEWKERVMIAATNPFVVIVRDDSELEVTVCGQRYVFPRGDVLLLPIDNISAEALAAHTAELLRARLSSVLPAHVTALTSTVEESLGQGASCTLSLQ
ncbi:MAG: 6-pyruvoyl tetrahydropterin synthase family protein [Kofleriaceae bacterium]